MCICVCVCVCICVQAFECACMHMCVFVYLCAGIRVCIYACVWVCGCERETCDFRRNFKFQQILRVFYLYIVNRHRQTEKLTHTHTHMQWKPEI